MNALDITARGLARRAIASSHLLASPIGAAAIGTSAGSSVQAVIDATGEGAVNLRARSEETAEALEALAAEHAMLTGYAGDSHTVEIAPYLTRDNLVIRGNGAELRNVNPRVVSDTDIAGVALPLGSSNFVATASLTFHAIDSVGSTGAVLDLGANAERYAVGDLVVLHGQSGYTVPVNGVDTPVYRNYLRARVVAVSNPYVTIDRMPFAELMSDGPQMGNTAEGVDPGFGDGPDAFYLLFNPHISDLRLASDFGEAWKWGGVIDGRIRDIDIDARNGVAFNAMQDCLFEGIRFRAWRKIAELGEGSVGTVYRNVRGILASAAGMAGDGVDDYPVFFIGMNENCRDCVMDDFDVSSGPNDPISFAVVLGSGCNNRITNSTLRFPALTKAAVQFQSLDVIGNGQTDCGLDRVEVHAPGCASFVNIYPGDAGITRPFVRDCKFFGTPTVAAAQIGYPGKTLTGGTLDNVWFEHGSLVFSGTVTGLTIRNCYIPGGFANLSNVLLAANAIRDNESDASRAANASAHVEQAHNSTAATAANSVYAAAAFPAGSLAAGDRVHIYVDATSGNSTLRSARVSATHGGASGTTSALGANARGTAGAMFIEGEILVISDTELSYRMNLWGSLQESFIVVESIASYGLTVNLELWTASSADSIGVRCVRIIPVKPGMKHLPLR